MAEESFFGDSMTITLETDEDTPTDITVGAAKSVAITVTAEHVELTSADTILREDVAKRDLSVDVTVGFAAFDMSLVEEWLGGGEGNATSPTDTSDVAQFSLEGEITAAGGGTTHTATVSGVYFPSVPVFDAAEGEWVTKEVDGDGKTITLS